MTPPVALLLANAEVGMASMRIARSVDAITDRHALPGLLLDLYQSVEALLDLAWEIDPDIQHAMALGIRTTHALPEPDLIPFTLETDHV